MDSFEGASGKGGVLVKLPFLGDYAPEMNLKKIY